MGGSTYAYDGLGNRVRQTVGTVVTQYLLDLQPGLTQMLAQTAGAATDHFVHGPAGVLSQRDSAGGWEWPLGVVVDQPGIEVGLQRADGVVEGGAQRGQHRHTADANSLPARFR